LSALRAFMVLRFQIIIAASMKIIALMMEAVSTSDTAVRFYETA
jgi:hypothetical protein